MVLQAEVALKAARAMVAAGADIIDVGGQSTRPGARAISAGQELKRILPVIRCALNPKPDYLLDTLDTLRPTTRHWIT